MRSGSVALRTKIIAAMLSTLPVGLACAHGGSSGGASSTGGHGNGASQGGGPERGMGRHHRGFFGDGDVADYEPSWDPWVTAVEHRHGDGSPARGRRVAPTPGRAVNPETRSASPAFGPAPELIPSVPQRPRR